ncbi:MAG: putative primase/helicase [Thermococcaceae archaeon]|nr:putative primase/helicase [Thermococcaceae archaeon]
MLDDIKKLENWVKEIEQFYKSAKENGLSTIKWEQMPLALKGYLIEQHDYIPTGIEISGISTIISNLKHRIESLKAQDVPIPRDIGVSNEDISERKEFKEEIDKIDVLEKSEKISEVLGFHLVDEIKPHLVADILLANFHFATMVDTEEIYYYEAGVYKAGGEILIKKVLQNAFRKLNIHDKLNQHFVNEVLEHIRRSTFTERSEFEWIINVKNGLLDLRTLKLNPHTPEYKSLIQLPVIWNPNARCELWDEFISEIVNPEDVKVLQEFAGYLLLRDCRFQKALMLVGSGANGKSTFIQVISQMLGKENCSFRSLHELIENRFASADLYGKLANIYDDLSSETITNTGIFKILVSGGEIQAEKKFKNSFRFQNFAKLVFSANKVPSTIDDTQAFYRRWIVITFPNQFVGDKADPYLLEKLTTPECLSYILKWSLEGLKRLLKQGRFSYTHDFEELQESYLRVSSPVYAFVNDMLEQGSMDNKIPKDEVYGAYVQYCKEHKLPVVTKRAFSMQLPKYINAIDSYTKREGKTVRAWSGIKFKKHGDHRSTSRFF